MSTPIEENQVKTEEIQTKENVSQEGKDPLTKPKKPRSEKQMAVFQKCAEVRRRNIALRKQEKEKEIKKKSTKTVIVESESEGEEIVYVKKRPKKQIVLKRPKLKRSKNIVYIQGESSSEEEESDEESEKENECDIQKESDKSEESDESDESEEEYTKNKKQQQHYYSQRVKQRGSVYSHLPNFI